MKTRKKAHIQKTIDLLRQFEDLLNDDAVRNGYACNTIDITTEIEYWEMEKAILSNK